MHLDRAVTAVQAVTAPTVPLVPDEPGYAMFAAAARHRYDALTAAGIAWEWEHLSTEGRDRWRDIAAAFEHWQTTGTMPPQ